MPSSPAPRRSRPARPLACARHLIATVPPLMKAIRTEMRRAAPEGLTVPQFRVLIFARSFPGASITELAEHLGVTLPTASVTADRLIRQGLLQAPQIPGNRRRRALRLTDDGAAAIGSAMEATADAFATRLATLSREELALVEQALTLLESRMVEPLPASVSASRD